ncbi:MAG: peptidoglycan editing factor PgeF [Candidatus Wallbacteria bacterium]|nr:peptidoglycan editing factor PgeF [Candidatus Wallbacteria bacterium]
MPLELHENNGVAYLTSPLLGGVPGIEHAFSTRKGGISPAPHDTLNLGFYSQDWNDNVTANWDRFLAAAGCQWHGVWYQNQCHGVTVREAPEVSGYAVLGEGDALWTREAGVGLAIVTADCVPVLAATADGRAVAAAHAGWRGMAAGVVEATLTDLARGSGAGSGELVVAAGPHIQPCCFEVKDDVAEPFGERFGQDVVRREGGRTTVALGAALRKLLERAGVSSRSIEISSECTACNPQLYFSYRRDKGRERGRLASVIGRAAAGEGRNGR